MYLPIEVVLNVIPCCIPDPDAILSPSHPITKTLLSFTLVCHETRRTANRLLRNHCAYLDSSKRLRSFLLQIRKRPELRELTSLSLAPFDEDIDDLPRCSWVRELLYFASETLTRLVIDMPLRTCYPEDGHLSVRPVLRAGFDRLINLVEFVSTQDELYLDVSEFENARVWKGWPKLKRLALYNPDLDEDFWRDVAEHTSLEMVVFSNVDGIVETNAKEAYFSFTSRPLKVIFCLSWQWGRGRRRHFEPIDWQSHDPDNKMTILERYIAKADDEDDKNRRYPLQEYIRAAADDGSLWKNEGRIITKMIQLARDE